MMLTSRFVPAFAPVAVAVVLVLSACSPTPTPTGTPGSSPTATEAPPTIVAPTPLLELDCDDLVSPTTLGTLFTSGVAEVDPEQSALEVAHLIPYKYEVEQGGGLACEWSNGEPHSANLGDNPAYRGATVTVSKVAPEDWSSFVDYYGVVDDRQVYCFEDCFADVFVDGTWWLEASLEGTDAADPLAAFTAQVVAIEAAVAAAGTSDESWSPPEETLPLGTECEDLLPAASVQGALGVADNLQALRPAGGVSLDATVRASSDSLWCNYLLTIADLGAGSLYWLRGGEWAWEEARTLELAEGPPEEITVAGLEAGDSAWIRCPAAATNCTVDLVVGHNWLEFTHPVGEVVSSADPRAALEAIAAEIVATVRS